LSDLLKTSGLRAVLDLPVGVHRQLTRRRIFRDGQSLSAEIQLLLRLQDLTREPHVEDLPLEEARAALLRQTRMVGGSQPIGAVRDLVVDGADGALAARLYTPQELLRVARRPTLLFLHGGGMMYGDLESHDAACRFLAEHAGVQVLAVDYRLAPEHRFPAAVEDAAAAYRWLVAHVDDVDADRDRLAVGGDSAGGYLSATTAVTAAEEGLPLALQVLVYPCTDFTRRSRSRELFGEGFYLSGKFMDRATAAYFGAEDDLANPRASVLMQKVLPDGLAPAMVFTAGFDPLRDEGEAYADLLAEQGVPVQRHRFTTMIHGFFNMVGVGHEARSYNADIAAAVRAALV
jgi:acetyl esterase